jgi:hypothetical protein
MNSEYTSATPPFAEFNRRTFFGILLIAGCTAVMTLIVARLLNQFVVAPALCGSAQTICTNSVSVSFHLASLIAAIAAVAMFVNLSVYRPLLVVIAALIGSWGIYGQAFPLITMSWYLQLAIIFFVNSVSFLAFAWILRAYNLAAGLVLTVVISALMILAITL